MVPRRRKAERVEHLLGLLKVRVLRGVNLAYRDARGSDPYVVLRMGSQKVKTGVKKKNVNPEWNEELTLSVSDHIQPIKLCAKTNEPQESLSMPKSPKCLSCSLPCSTTSCKTRPNTHASPSHTVSLSNCVGRPCAIQRQRDDGDLVVDDVGHGERFRCGCLFLLALSHKKKHALPHVSGSQVATEANQDGQESTGTASRAASLEKFECESWSSSAILDGDGDGDDVQSYFDLPLELIRSSRNGANSPVKAAFVFESDRKGSLKRSTSKLAPRKSHELSNRHVKFSTSPASYPASPSSYCTISPRMQKAREEFHAFLEARNA
ncbi:unnamed protein product [Musa acuminata subsp. burmannicoides]